MSRNIGICVARSQDMTAAKDWCSAVGEELLDFDDILYSLTVMKTVRQIIDRYPGDENSIIQIMQDIQNEFNYLPRETLVEVSRALRVPLGRLYSVATFYSAFSLKPRGKYHFTVCVGTACHVRGAQSILQEFEKRLGIKEGENTEDMKYSLESVNCLGCCAIGPIVVCNGVYHGEFKLKDVSRLLEENL